MMTDKYPASSQTWETIVVVPAGIALLLVLAYSGISGSFSESDTERLTRFEDIWPSIKVLLASFGLALAAPLLRTFTKNTPFGLIWVGLLVCAAIALISGVLQFLGGI